MMIWFKLVSSWTFASFMIFHFAISLVVLLVKNFFSVIGQIQWQYEGMIYSFQSAKMFLWHIIVHSFCFDHEYVSSLLSLVQFEQSLDCWLLVSLNKIFWLMFGLTSAGQVRSTLVCLFTTSFLSRINFPMLYIQIYNMFLILRSKKSQYRSLCYEHF